MQSNELKRPFVHNVGIFLVCVEISKRNLIAFPKTSHKKGCDIVALNPNTNRQMEIQVKAARGEKDKFQIFHSYWRDYEEKIEQHIYLDCVFVDILDLGKPFFFIVPKNDLREITKYVINEYATRSMKKNNLTWQGIIDEGNKKQSNPKNWAIAPSNISKYMDNWPFVVESVS